MGNPEQAGTAERQSPAHEAPGGRTSRGPDYDVPGEIQVSVPPYDEERGEASAEGAEGVRKAFDASNAPAPGAALPETDEEREGMSATEMNPEPALGVGESHGRRAEDTAPDRPDVGTKDGRPVGKVEGHESGSPRDSESPDLQAGGG